MQLDPCNSWLSACSDQRTIEELHQLRLEGPELGHARSPEPSTLVVGQSVLLAAHRLERFSAFTSTFCHSPTVGALNREVGGCVPTF